MSALNSDAFGNSGPTQQQSNNINSLLGQSFDVFATNQQPFQSFDLPFGISDISGISYSSSPCENMFENTNSVKADEKEGHSESLEETANSPQEASANDSDKLKIVEVESPDEHFKRALELYKKASTKGKGKGKQRKSSVGDPSDKKAPIQRKNSVTCKLEGMSINEAQSGKIKKKGNGHRARVNSETGSTPPVIDNEAKPWALRDLPTSFFNPKRSPGAQRRHSAPPLPLSPPVSGKELNLQCLPPSFVRGDMLIQNLEPVNESIDSISEVDGECSPAKHPTYAAALPEQGASVGIAGIENNPSVLFNEELLPSFCVNNEEFNMFAHFNSTSGYNNGPLHM
eukprot:Nk52_evm19s1129 gene=Nk52_evmTU19s1129